MALTPEERRKLALAEVHAHRPAGQQEVLTLQLDHPAFDEPARVCADNAELDARLEDGEVVTFRDVAFSAIGPSQGGGRWPEIEISIDNAATILEPHLEAALDSDAPIAVTARYYLRSQAMDGPARVMKGLELDKTSTGDLSVSGTAGFYGLDKQFGTSYDPTEYPGIV